MDPKERQDLEAFGGWLVGVTLTAIAMFTGVLLFTGIAIAQQEWRAVRPFVNLGVAALSLLALTQAPRRGLRVESLVSLAFLVLYLVLVAADLLALRP